MEVPAEIFQVSSQLAAAVELTMDPLASQERRFEAYTACEQFKETSPLCAQCGLYLAQRTDLSHYVRHFGLQLMEHCVKYRWNQITHEEKLYIKENAMKLLGIGMDPQLQEYTHIKDALSRIIVEMIKREWPQQWPTLLNELFATCGQGASQTELVCFVFLRLVEDVALLQTLESQQRRKDIYQALTMNMGEIFGFFIRLIKDHWTRWHSLAALGTMQGPEALGSAKVVKAVLMMLTGYVEWVNIGHIMAGDLLQILCLLLDNDNFQRPAAECLLQIVNRKGKVEERTPLMILFDTELMGCIFRAAHAASAKPLGEHHYTFLKKLTQVLTGLGSQLCTLWGKDDGPLNRPPNFAIYLDAILPFSQHPSLTLVHYASTLWLQLFKHDLISKDAVFLTFVPKWVAVTAPRIVKVGFPSNRNGGNREASAYARLDHDSDDEYSVFFHRCRMDLLETFRQATLVAPLVTFAYVQRWLTECIEQAAQGDGAAPAQTECHVQSAKFLEWEAMSQLLESVLSRILIPQERPPVASGLHLLELCLAFQPADPLVLSTLLSCISALFVFLSMAPPSPDISATLARVLHKIFATLTYSLPGQTKDNRSRVVKNVRRHAASLMVKIGQKYPLLLLPLFDQIHTTIRGLTREPSELSKLETVTLLEALVLINNHFCDYARQTQFIGEVICEGAQQWLACSTAFRSHVEFMAFVGLDRPPVEPSSNDLNGKNRSQIMCCVNLLLGVVKRSSWPEDPDRAQRGGFVVSRTETGNPVCRNPATQHVVPLMPSVLGLLRVFNALWTPEALALLSEGYKGAYNLLEVDRCNLLSLGNPSQFADPVYTAKPRSQTPLDRMQQFLSIVHDSCYHILGNAGPSLGRDFYQLPNLVPMIVESVFSNLERIPDYRLRPMVRVFLKPFVHSCPPAFHDTVVLPILKQFCPFMFTRLDAKWQYITQVFENGDMDDDNTDTQEVLEDMLNRTVTREYIDLLKIGLLGGSSDLTCGDLAMEEGVESKTGTSTQTEVMSDLGVLMLRSESTCNPVAQCLLRALSWNDTVACLKATSLVGPVVRQLSTDGLMNVASACHILTSVLQGLHRHGQHEHNQGSLVTLGVQAYELLRPSFPPVRDVMLAIPGCTPAELKKLDDKFMNVPSKTNKLEKAKKDIFKKLTSPLMGRGTGQLFRKEVSITNLPTLIIKKKGHPKNPGQSLDPEALQNLFNTC